MGSFTRLGMTGAVLAAGLAFSAGGAFAATCSAGAVGKITQNTTGLAAACDAGTINNDKLNPLQVNVDALHGFDDWLYAGKQEFGGDFEIGTVDVGFGILGGPKTGTWDFVDTLFSLYENVMIVMKGGGGQNTQETYVGYLLNSTLASSGNYQSPFLNPKDGTAKDISHMTAYVRGKVDIVEPPAPIPLPAAGWLMIAGLAGLGALRARKRT